ncbi:MAG: type II secretion system protein GspN [Deltaproteobacteria bacterium]|nr:type II secretion system protein GspN [Deltaproteobacteria bacterium]
MKKNVLKKYFCYLLSSIILLIGFLFCLFPSDAFRDYLQSTFDLKNPGYSLSIIRVSPVLPLGLKFKQADISLKSDPGKSIFLSDRFLIKPDLWSFLQGKFRYVFDCLAYDGNLTGSIHFTEKIASGPFTTKFKIKDVNFYKDAGLSNLIGHEAKGILGGNVTYSGQNDKFINGKGEADIRISEGRVELVNSILPFKSLDFDELNVKLVLKNQKVSLDHCEVSGGDLLGSLSGVIRLKKDLSKSILNLTGTIKPIVGSKNLKDSPDTLKFFRQYLKKGRISFIIRGTLAKPQFKMGASR